MPTPFGPQLIGETEKSLNAVLVRTLAGRLTEPQWVTLRVAASLDGQAQRDHDLATRLAERAHFTNAPSLISELSATGLLARGRLTDAGRALLTELKDSIDQATVAIWRDLPDADVEATARVLNEVISRARTALASLNGDHDDC